MKVTIEFDDQDDAITAMQGIDWKSTVWNLDQYLRYTIKHSDKEETDLQTVRDQLHGLLNEYNLNLDV
jgi:hypothetical protein